MSSSKICLIGDIVVDVSLKTTASPTRMRLGGLVHAARCLWALDIPFSVGYFAPAYLDGQISNYLQSLGCVEQIKLGNIIGSPYVFLIEETKEVGNQGYEFLLRDEVLINYKEDACKALQSRQFDDCIVISGNYDLERICSYLPGRIHLDVANNIKDFQPLQKVDKKVATIFVSTSSKLFSDFFEGDFEGYARKFEPYSEIFVLKENRGGSRAFDFLGTQIFSAPSQTRPIQHSVGVGDVYDTVFVAKGNSMPIEERMILSSWIAGEYAETTYPDDFKINVGRLLKSSIKALSTLGGTRLPWEARKNISIYIAAPDFDHVDTKHVDVLDAALTYHNFFPRRPIKENGQLEQNPKKARKQEVFAKDMALLKDCKLLIAVLLYNDPGTLIEIGLAAAMGMPTIVYDPYRIAANCMLTELPMLVTDNLDEIIATIFIKAEESIKE